MTKPRYGSDIPKARERLLLLAQELRYDAGMNNYAEEIEAIVRGLMWRTFSGREGKGAPKKLTPALVAQVEYYLTNTDMTQQSIGELLGINAGRVSEIANDLRDANGAVRF